jgi:hypothetical protein
MTLSETTNDIHGRCYCGAVKFSIAADTKPLLAGYCHCKDCRQAHSAPVYQYVYMDQEKFSITDGKDLLNTYTRNESVTDHFRRYFCSQCGSKVYNFMHYSRDNNNIDLCGTFPSLFDDQKIAMSNVWSPKKHVHCSESILDLECFTDSLPRS